MKTATDILKEKCPGIILFGLTNGQMDSVLVAMEEYAIQKLEATVASYEIDRVNLVAMTLERDELDEEIKRLGTERKQIIEANASMAVQNMIFQSQAQRLQEEVDKWYKAFQELTKSHIEKSNDAREYRQLFDEHKARYEFTLGRVNGLEEWLTEYRDQLKKENAYHKNTGIINAINELLNES
jgi:uncharacterized protein YdiU (UPF0061 family)